MAPKMKYDPDLELRIKIGEFSEKDLVSKGFIDPDEVAKIDKEMANERRVLGNSALRASQFFVG